MGEVRRTASDAVVFALMWIGIGFVACLVVGVVAGLVRDDVGGTLGPVVQWGMSGVAIAVVMALAFRRTPS